MDINVKQAPVYICYFTLIISLIPDKVNNLGILQTWYSIFYLHVFEQAIL